MHDCPWTSVFVLQLTSQRSWRHGQIICCCCNASTAHRAHLTLAHACAPQIVRLALLSLLAVFRDILPGYRIRLPTEKELAMPVSKDVKRTRDYEASLLRLYQVASAMIKLVMRRHKNDAIYVLRMCVVWGCNVIRAPAARSLQSAVPFALKKAAAGRSRLALARHHLVCSCDLCRFLVLHTHTYTHTHAWCRLM